MAEESAPAEAAVVAALAALPGATAARMQRLLRIDPPARAWERVKGGTVDASVAPAAVLASWRRQASTVDLGPIGGALDRLRVTVTSHRDPRHPSRLMADVDPAPVIFARGSVPCADLPHVAIVGTRRSSSPGREVARELGAGLAQAGVVVVSGLALGIDGAAHRGALLGSGAPPLAVVGSGIDVVYPARHIDLWEEIVEAGAVITEAPLGAPAEPWRFPARNRLIAAFADLLIVVESRAVGGSLLTVEQAIRRGVDVMAVPGSVRNPAAEGTNQLLADGCPPVRDVDDVLVALGLSRLAGRQETTGERRDAVPAALGLVFGAVDDGPTSVDEIVARTGLGVLEVHAQLEQLVARGHLCHDGARVCRA